MLTQIKKVKGLGVFEDYSAAADAPTFGRFNVVYGENGTGKTTLSRLFACLDSGQHSDHPNLDFAIESQLGPVSPKQRYARKVRVFNSDYVEANIGRFDGPLRHILVLGEENKALAAELRTEIQIRDSRTQKIEIHTAAVAKLESDKGKIFSQIAKTIGEATSGSTLRSYRKPDAESAFAKLRETRALADDILEGHRATVRQNQMENIGTLTIPRVPTGRFDDESDAVQFAARTAERVCTITQKSAQSAVIERLAQNPRIAAWVDEGVDIHTSHASGRCEFCDRDMPSERMKELAEHFSAEDQALKAEIESERSLIAATLEALGEFKTPDRLALYSELRAEYDLALDVHTHELANVRRGLEDADQALERKLTLRTTAYATEVGWETSGLVAAIESLNAVCKRHDEKTAGFEREKLAARSAIETHYLTTVSAQIAELAVKISKLQKEMKLLRDGGEPLEDKRSLEELSQSITEKQVKVSNAHAAGADLTDHLKQFLGRTDLKFESGESGYHVLRRGKAARRLSEGEKTAIAFLYFLVQLKDQDFDITEGVVVIDDPISSLDASAIYQAFSFLKNSVHSAKQVFLLTHNFEFLRLLINWVKNIPAPKTDKVFAMVLCAETADGRRAHIAPLDKMLIEHATEYHYLFKVLYKFKSDGTILGCYHVPNMARKVLETFLDFHVPSSKSLYQKLEETKFDTHKKTAIYKFANDLSHHTGKSFDPALVSETQKNTGYLLEMIESVAPLHYEGLKKLSEA